MFGLGWLKDSWGGQKRFLLHWVPLTTMLQLAYQRVQVVGHETQYEEALMVIEVGKLLRG